MSPINKAELMMQAAEAAYRVDFVRKDPAVRKAAAQAWGDLQVAGRSTADLGREVSAAWTRSRGGGSGRGATLPR